MPVTFNRVVSASIACVCTSRDVITWIMTGRLGCFQTLLTCHCIVELAEAVLMWYTVYTGVNTSTHATILYGGGESAGISAVEYSVYMRCLHLLCDDCIPPPPSSLLLPPSLPPSLPSSSSILTCASLYAVMTNKDDEYDFLFKGTCYFTQSPATWWEVFSVHCHLDKYRVANPCIL